MLYCCIYASAASFVGVKGSIASVAYSVGATIVIIRVAVESVIKY